MYEHTLISLASIIILGMIAQWLAWRLKFPSILFLLIFGFLAGPVTGFLNPDELLGQLLLPVVSISVAVILFEGGLTLKLSELREIGKVVFFLISGGLLVTGCITAAAAYYIVGLNLKLSILTGAILVVTGPTVIGPLLRHIRPIGTVGRILKWEGIVIDPVGALLAVLVFEAIFTGEIPTAGTVVLTGILKTILFGSLSGGVFAGILVLLLKRFWIPDFLQEAVALMLVVSAYLSANLLQPEAGLFAATLMGLLLDNQKQVSIQHIVEFKENLRVLIISSLFIILAARLELSAFRLMDYTSLVFLGILILIARPAAVLLSTIGSRLSWRERAFVAWMAPRGIVAAAVASLFAMRLAETGLPQIELLVPLTFTVIVGTVGIYGLTAKPVAAWLQVAQSNPQGVLIVGAHSWARNIAALLQSQGFRVCMIDTNRAAITSARLEGIPALHGDALAEDIPDKLDLDGIGRLLALSSNDEVNSLAVINFSKVFESQELYQLTPQKKTGTTPEKTTPQHLRGRFLFAEEATFHKLNRLLLSGWIIKSTRLTPEFDYQALQDHYRAGLVPLFIITAGGDLRALTADASPEPGPGQMLVSVVREPDHSGEELKPGGFTQTSGRK